MKNLGVTTEHIGRLGMLDASDQQIFHAARSADAVVLTKDRDFVDLVRRLGAPPPIIWVRSGNTSNEVMQRILKQTLRQALKLIEGTEPIVEIKVRA